jgi:hypothetical protein
MCLPLPIDVVYTWVNGSDPRLVSALQAIKDELAAEANRTAMEQLAAEAEARLANPPPATTILPSPTPTPSLEQSHSVDASLFPSPTATVIEEDGNSTLHGNGTAAEPGLPSEDEKTSASRFEDNEELRFSIRSLMKHTPWIRNIFIVTNGQVPAWLNLDNPRVRVVPHDEIFDDKSHLPTFSSPAIESHIHKIRGLSDRFLYLNDDVMFGREVWPDDFYTHALGHKVYLAWPVPNCADACPNNWLGDGFCDLACNTTSCDYDARDCVGVNVTTSRYGNWYNNQARTGDAGAFCALGCPDTWIGDRYCDRACNLRECAFDAGDCTTERMSTELFHATVLPTTTFLPMPAGHPAVYLNLSRLVGTNDITEGFHNNPTVIRTATISQKLKIMSFTFHRNITEQLVEIYLRYRVNATHEQEAMFNLSVVTAAAEVPLAELNYTAYAEFQSAPPVPSAEAPLADGAVRAEALPGNFTSVLNTTVAAANDTAEAVASVAVRIEHSSEFLHSLFQVTVNETLEREERERKLPDLLAELETISGRTVVPGSDDESIISPVRSDFLDGDITARGFLRRALRLLLPNSTASLPVLTATVGNASFAEAMPGEFGASRQLLSFENSRASEWWTDLQNEAEDDHGPRMSRHPHWVDEHEFLAKWIADSKKKQLRLASDLRYV